MKKLSNKNMVDVLTMGMQEVVNNLKDVANDEEIKLCLSGRNLTNKDIKEEIEREDDEYSKRELQHYFALRAAIYHLESIFNRPASFI